MQHADWCMFTAFRSEICSLSGRHEDGGSTLLRNVENHHSTCRNIPEDLNR